MPSLASCLEERPATFIYMICTESVVFISTLWSAFSLGTIYLFTQSAEQVFGELYGWDAIKGGYVQAAIVIGELIGWVCRLLTNHWYYKSALRNTEIPGVEIPEARLYQALVGGLVGVTGGMFVYAWTSYSFFPWIAPAICLAMVGAGSVCVIVSTANYLVDAYSMNRQRYSSMGPISQDNALAACYQLVLSCEEKVIVNKIRLRLLYVAFYRVKQDIQPGSQYEYSDAAKFIAEAISHASSIEDSFDIIHKKIRTWIGYGESDSETLWTKELPKSSTRGNRVSILQKLKESGICEEANVRSLHSLAEQEVERVSKPLKDAVHRGISRRLSQTPFSATREPSGTGIQSPEDMSSNAPNNFEQPSIMNPSVIRVEATCTQNRPNSVSQNAICPPMHLEPSSIHIPDANMVAGSSTTESHQSSDSLDDLQAPIDTASSSFHLNGALPGNHPGLGQQAIQRCTNVSPPAGFFHVLQAFQGATVPTGYTDATEAISTDFHGHPGQFWNAMQDASRRTNTQANQRTTWLEGSQLSSDNTGIDGYHNVYQAIQPSSLSGFIDANFAMQGGWDT
ncbi:uncharacterized protein BDW43DRAFT_308938 [Aspergillus alliaceus]|uniref:uncharacterized protein n=1 Tax=Petromyces alliaceus TaxID=209559 RepID=UPI0012A406EB|nr:uncharacterized protein BDW43DRAFT_308938 [Aspergillus alliaceus]KAB8235602.1 hypothetical protein BDW43DRAFT_308938 [Aspergillus alliaceus]